jgi:energy-coupling factor transporter ATP-binding protein EcfA2
MLDVRAKFRELTRVFDPIYRPYQDASDGPGSSYVPEAHEDYRKQLELTLDLNDKAKLLMAGQPGCGKTTLLLSVGQKLRRDGRIAAFVDLEAQTAVQDLGSVEMHVATIAALLVQAKAAAAPLSAATLAACRRWLTELQGGAEPGADPEAIAVAFGRQLSAVQESKALRDELRDLVKRGKSEDPQNLLARLLDDLASMRPVVILDGLDKLPPSQARDTFLDDKKKPMAELPGAAILTVPLSIVYESTFNVLGERYNNAGSAVLPAVRPWELDAKARKRTRSDYGFGVLQRIIAVRVDPIDPAIILPEAVDRAVVGSGGNIRELARLMQASVVKAAFRGGSFIEPQDIEVAIADQRESFRRGYDSRFRPVLTRVRDEYRLEDSNEVSKQLLYGLWVTEYRNGYVWYSLPVPVEQLLEHLERTRP